MAKKINEAVVLVDMQKDFCSDGFYYSLSGKDIAPLKEALSCFDDFKNSSFFKNRFVIVVNSIYDENQFGHGKKICVRGSEGAEMAVHVEADVTFTKHQHSVFSNESFVAFLREKKIKGIYFLGFTSEFCIFQSANDSLKYGYSTAVLEKYTATNSERKSYRDAAFMLLKLYGAQIVTCVGGENV